MCSRWAVAIVRDFLAQRDPWDEHKCSHRGDKGQANLACKRPQRHDGGAIPSCEPRPGRIFPSEAALGQASTPSDLEAARLEVERLNPGPTRLRTSSPTSLVEASARVLDVAGTDQTIDAAQRPNRAA